MVFSKEGNKPDTSKLEETEKNRHQKMQKFKKFFGFPTFVKWFIPNYSTLKYNHISLKTTFTKGNQFWLEWKLP